ncbi:MAG: hypothetical protein KDC84_00655 [Crocinitomicaceae bacterium]|nr:hypothetical protein [Crocinitomicaceae bacterium]
MKHLLFLSFLLITGFLFSQKVPGFTIKTSSSVAIKNSDQFALTNGEVISKIKQENTFTISFSDSLFVHTPGPYKSKEGKKEMISQVYKITNILAVKDKKGIDLFLLTVKSGLSGKSYDYYLEYNGSKVHITQIMEMKGTKETGYNYTGIRFENPEFCLIRPYKK